MLSNYVSIRAADEKSVCLMLASSVGIYFISSALKDQMNLSFMYTHFCDGFKGVCLTCEKSSAPS